MPVLLKTSKNLNSTPMAKAIKKWLGYRFGHPEKWLTISETEQFNPREDRYAYEQNVGRLPEVVEVYIKAGDTWEYVCDIQEHDQEMKSLQNVQLGLLKLKDKFEHVLGFKWKQWWFLNNPPMAGQP